MQSFADIPSWLASAWTIDLITAQILITTAVFSAMVLPILVLRTDRSSFNVEILAGFLALILCVGLGWLHYWVLIMAIFVVGFMVALFGTALVLGGSGKGG